MGHYMLFPDHRESNFHKWSNTNQKLCSTILLDDQRQVWQARRHFWQNAFRAELLDWCVGNLCILVAQLVVGQPYTRVCARALTHTHTQTWCACAHMYKHSTSTLMDVHIYLPLWRTSCLVFNEMLVYVLATISCCMPFAAQFGYYCFFFCLNRTRSKERGRKTRQWVVTFRLLGLVRPNLPLGNCQWISVCRPQDWTMTVSKRARKTNNFVEEADWESCAGIWFPDSLIQLKHICTDKFNHQIVLEKLWKLRLKA